MPKYVSLADAAKHARVTERTIHNYIARGYFPAYLFEGESGHFVELDEMKHSLALLPPRVARPGVQAFGPKAKIIEKPRRPQVVPSREKSEQ